MVFTGRLAALAFLKLQAALLKVSSLATLPPSWLLQTLSRQGQACCFGPPRPEKQPCYTVAHCCLCCLLQTLSRRGPTAQGMRTRRPPARAAAAGDAPAALPCAASTVGTRRILMCQMLRQDACAASTTIPGGSCAFPSLMLFISFSVNGFISTGAPGMLSDTFSYRSQLCPSTQGRHECFLGSPATALMCHGGCFPAAGIPVASSCWH